MRCGISRARFRRSVRGIYPDRRLPSPMQVRPAQGPVSPALCSAAHRSHLVGVVATGASGVPENCLTPNQIPPMTEQSRGKSAVGNDVVLAPPSLALPGLGDGWRPARPMLINRGFERRRVWPCENGVSRKRKIRPAAVNCRGRRCLRACPRRRRPVQGNAESAERPSRRHRQCSPCRHQHSRLQRRQLLGDMIQIRGRSTEEPRGVAFSRSRPARHPG